MISPTICLDEIERMDSVFRRGQRYRAASPECDPSNSERQLPVLSHRAWFTNRFSNGPTQAIRKDGWDLNASRDLSRSPWRASVLRAMRVGEEPSTASHSW